MVSVGEYGKGQCNVGVKMRKYTLKSRAVCPAGYSGYNGGCRKKIGKQCESGGKDVGVLCTDRYDYRATASVSYRYYTHTATYETGAFDIPHPYYQRQYSFNADTLLRQVEVLRLDSATALRP